MRQPKFRGYNLETNTWYYGHGWFECDYTEEYKQEKGIEDRAILYTDGSPVECELASMGEFTGLYDKKGNEIYIGDIVALVGETTEGFYRTDHYEVIINDFMQIPVIDSERGQEVLYKVNKICEVVGNITEEKLPR